MLPPAIKQHLDCEAGGLQLLDLHRNNPHGLWLPWDDQPDILRPLKGSVGKKLCLSFLGFETVQQPEGFVSPPFWRTSLQKVCCHGD